MNTVEMIYITYLFTATWIIMGIIVGKQRPLTRTEILEAILANGMAFVLMFVIKN